MNANLNQYDILPLVTITNEVWWFVVEYNFTDMITIGPGCREIADAKEILKAFLED